MIFLLIITYIYIFSNFCKFFQTIASSMILSGDEKKGSRKLFFKSNTNFQHSAGLSTTSLQNNWLSSILLAYKFVSISSLPCHSAPSSCATTMPSSNAPPFSPLPSQTFRFRLFSLRGTHYHPPALLKLTLPALWRDQRSTKVGYPLWHRSGDLSYVIAQRSQCGRAISTLALRKLPTNNVCA